MKNVYVCSLLLFVFVLSCNTSKKIQTTERPDFRAHKVTLVDTSFAKTSTPRQEKDTIVVVESQRGRQIVNDPSVGYYNKDPMDPMPKKGTPIKIRAQDMIRVDTVWTHSRDPDVPGKKEQQLIVHYVNQQGDEKYFYAQMGTLFVQEKILADGETIVDIAADKGD